MSLVLTEQRGHVLLITFNRPEKKNAANMQLLSEFSAALGELDRDPELRVGVVFAAGDSFTAGLDLADVAPRIQGGKIDYLPAGGCDPWRVGGPECSKPIVVAINGLCLTLGIEFALAADVVIASPDATFGQIEVARGILPFGGATLRLPARIGWSAAMQWMLGAGMHSATEALERGLLSEIVPIEQLHGRAIEIAEGIARNAPLAVQATLANARWAERNQLAAQAALPEELTRLIRSQDAQTAMAAYLSGTAPEFRGR